MDFLSITLIRLKGAGQSSQVAKGDRTQRLSPPHGERHKLNGEQVMNKKYGVELKEKREKVRPVPMDLSGKDGQRVVMAAVKRVMTIHADVIKALAKR